LRFQKLSWYLLGKVVDDFHKLKIEGKKKGWVNEKFCFKDIFLIIVFQDKTFTETNSTSLDISILKI